MSIQVIAIAMDVFTDVDIFKEVVDASVRGVPVYILLDHNHFKSFLNMVEKQDIQIQKLRVSVHILLYIAFKSWHPFQNSIIYYVNFLYLCLLENKHGKKNNK